MDEEYASRNKDDRRWIRSQKKSKSVSNGFAVIPLFYTDLGFVGWEEGDTDGLDGGSSTVAKWGGTKGKVAFNTFMTGFLFDDS